MFIVNTDYIGEEKISMLGLVSGSVVQSQHPLNDFVASLRTVVGGEIVEYTELMNEARTIATNRMIEEAEKLGAEAIVNVKYSSSEIMDGASEVMVYGTAIRYI